MSEQPADPSPAREARGTPYATLPPADVLALDRIRSRSVQNAAWPGRVSLRVIKYAANAELSRVAAPFLADKCKREAAKHWNRFYETHEARFFRDRHWTAREFEDIDALADSEIADAETPISLLEVGCGAGNTVFPLIDEYPHLRVLACDFSPKAVELVRSHPTYAASGRVTAFVHDLTEPSPSLRSRLGETPADIVTCLFVLSAIAPEKLVTAVRAMTDALRPGGVLLLREHAREDSAQLRFHTRKSANYSEPSLLDAERPLYRRADWTLMLFFSTEEIDALMAECGLQGASKLVTHTTTNRKRELTMERRFVQGRWVKPL